MALCISTKQSDFRGYPFAGPWVETKTQGFTRNNCGSGQQGSQVMYSKTYSSDVSAEHLQWLIDQDTSNYNSAGQANSNANGTCSSTCVPGTIPLSTRIVAINLSNVWTSGVNNGVSNAMAKSVLSPTFPSTTSSPIDRELKGRTFTLYPHNNVNTLYSVYVLNPNVPYLSLNFFLQTKNMSSSDACTPPSVRQIAESPIIGSGVNQRYNIIPTNFGVVVSSSGMSDGRHVCNVYYHNIFLNQTIKIYEQLRPSNHRYEVESLASVYDGSDVYIAMSFSSTANDVRTRTSFYRARFGLFGDFLNMEQIVPFDFSNQYLRMRTGVFAGNRLFFLYLEDGVLKTYPIYGGAPSNPPNIYLSTSCTSIRDSSNTNVAYIGDYSGNLLRYDASSNVWTHLK